MDNALTNDFGPLQPDSAVVELEWEKVAVPFKVSVDVHDVVQASDCGRSGQSESLPRRDGETAGGLSSSRRNRRRSAESDFVARYGSRVFAWYSGNQNR